MAATVTVLMPVRNAAAWLEASVTSLRTQTFTDWNCICVDDGSTDASPEILARTAAAEPRFRVITQSARGVSAARNALLDAADGEWIFFLDADDLLAHNCLDTLLACVRGQGVKLGWAQYERLTDAHPATHPGGGVRLLTGSSWQRLRARNYSLTRPASVGGIFENVPCQPWNKLVWHRLLDGLRFDEDLSRGEDLVFFAEVMRRTDSVAVSAQVTYFYRNTPGSLFSAGGNYGNFHAYVQAVCRFAERDRPPFLGGYLARRWILSWLRSVHRGAGLRKDPAAQRQFAEDCRRLTDAFSGRLPLPSRLALCLAPMLCK